MIERRLARRLKEDAARYPGTPVTGPRQCGETTLVKAVFGRFVVSELYKSFMHRGEQPRLCFWRDAAGHEIDAIIDMGAELIPVEIKSAQTVASDFFDNLGYWRNLTGNEDARSTLIYGGDRAFKRSGVFVYPWYVL